MTTDRSTVLDVEDLRVYYHTPQGPVKAVDGVSFDLAEGERLGLVGESGSGKSTTGLAILRLIKPPGKIEAGHIRLDGVDVLRLSEPAMRRIRLGAIALVAQGAMNSLNPVMRVQDQIIDALVDHGVQCPPSFRNVSPQAPDETNVVGRVNEDFDVHLLKQPWFGED